MIRGSVTARREAVVPLRVRRQPGGAELDLEALVDSGFTASLALPASKIAALGLVRQSSGNAMLANGSLAQFDIYAAEVEWDGGWRPLLVLEAGTEVLLGMRLLQGHELRIAVIEGGLVEITPLP